MNLFTPLIFLNILSFILHLIYSIYESNEQFNKEVMIYLFKINHAPFKKIFFKGNHKNEMNQKNNNHII